LPGFRGPLPWRLYNATMASGGSRACHSAPVRAWGASGRVAVTACPRSSSRRLAATVNA